MSRYNLNDVQCDVGCLKHLINAIQQTIDDVDFGTAENRNPHLEQADGLIRIARDLVITLDGKIDTHFNEIGSTTSGRLPDTSHVHAREEARNG